ncbi:hypothetical protein CNY89_14435 [Amaricoccus sp. HAR-UPW-R2A-40]|nr:hypothetical protein CNY89_14435 [Amaricoccus sp. HAR-UPW-R2A-40]
MDNETSIDRNELLALTAEIVSAYVGNNALDTGTVPDMIGAVFAKLTEISNDRPVRRRPAPASGAGQGARGAWRTPGDDRLECRDAPGACPVRPRSCDRLGEILPETCRPMSAPKNVVPPQGLAGFRPSAQFCGPRQNAGPAPRDRR